MNFDATTALGLAAATLTTAAFLPQVIKTWRTRQTRDISLVWCRRGHIPDRQGKYRKNFRFWPHVVPPSRREAPEASRRNGFRQ